MKTHPTLDTTKNILLLAAMKPELDAFIEPLKVTESSLGPLPYYIAEFDSGTKIYCVLCGAGKVNSASIAAAFLSQEDFNIGFVINSGTAGSLAKRLKKGDIVVGTEYAQHDYDLTTLFDNFKPGQMVGKENILDVVPQEIIEMLPKGDGIYFGTILSGDRFISTGLIIEHANPLAVDMESAAIAHLCYHIFKIPFVAVRVITDSADENAGQDWHAWLDKLSHNAAEYSRKVIDKLFSLGLNKPNG